LNDVRAAGLRTADHLGTESSGQAPKHWACACAAKKRVAAPARITRSKNWRRDPPSIATRPWCEFGVSEVA
jgi:hypothetical protein